MNLIHKLLLVLAVACSVLPVVREQTLTADAGEETDKYPMACKAFEVDNVNAEGGFDKVSCHNDFSSAMTAMKKLGDDGVVRHGGSYSPTKIIAMNNGMAFAYPFRSGSSLEYYYQDANFSSSYATTYSGQHYQMKYFDTVSYANEGNGTVKININGFEGYVRLRDVDLVPLRFFKDALSISLGGREIFYATPEEPYDMIPSMNSYTCVQNGNYKDMFFNSWYGWSEDGKNAFRFNKDLALPAAEWMKPGTVYYSYNGYDFYTDMGFHDYAGQYFNYYQFLPMRSKTKISAPVFDAFLKAQNVSSSSKLYNQAQCFIDAQNEYGVNALIVYAMACMESAYGTSYYAINRNNFFGWGAVDTNPNEAASFATVEEGIRKQMSENLAGFLDMNDYRYYGSMLGNKGAGFNLKYASGVYWGMQIAAIAYKIDKLSCSNNGQLTDHNDVAIGIVENSQAKASLTKGGRAAYDITCANGAYVPVYPVAILAAEDAYYKTQCTNYVVDGKLWFIDSSEDVRSYDWENSVGWFAKNDIRLINRDEISEQETEPGEAIETLDTFKLDGTLLSLGGMSCRAGVSVSNGNDPSAMLCIVNENYETVKEIPAKTAVSADGTIRWSAETDLKDLKEGSFFFKVIYTYANTPQYGSEFYLKKTDLPEPFIDHASEYTFAHDSQDFVSLKITKITCGQGSHYDEDAGGCAVDVTEPVYSDVPADDPQLMRGIDEVSFDPETSRITLRGLAFFKAMDAKAGTVTHELVLVNTETDTEYALGAATDDYDGQLKGGQYDLSDVGFKAELDLNAIAAGNYYLRIRTNNADRSGEGALFCNLEGIDCSVINQAGETVRFFANPLSNYRLEISIEKQSLDLDHTNKPSRMTSLFGYQSLNMENNTLQMDGIGIMYHASMSGADHVRYTLILQSESGELYRYEAPSRSSDMDFARIIGSKMPLDHVSFDLSADLSGLASGSYRMYLELETDTYRDVIEMYSITPDIFSAAMSDGRTCTLATTNVRSRYILRIE